MSYEQYAPLLLSERVWLAAATEEEFSARVLHPADRLFDEIGTKGAEWSQGPANAQRISEIVGALVATTRIILARGIALRLEPFVERLRRGSSRTSAARLLVAITMDRFTLPEAVERQFVAALQEYNGADLLKYAIGARPSDNYKILLDVVRDLIEERDAKGISADIVKLAPDAIREAAKANDLLASLMRE